MYALLALLLAVGITSLALWSGQASPRVHARGVPIAATGPAVPAVPVEDAPAVVSTSPSLKSSPSPAGTSVSFSIPRQTFVVLGRDGAPVAAMTNTMQAPSPADQFFVSGDDPPRPLDAGRVAEVVRRSSGGDWREPGRYVLLS